MPHVGSGGADVSVLERAVVGAANLAQFVIDHACSEQSDLRPLSVGRR